MERLATEGMTTMKRYLISVYQPDGPTPPPEVLDKIMTDLTALNAELRSAGAWVFGGKLHPASTATVLRARDGEVLLTDGPFAEGKEHLGGFTVIAAPDLDAALAWAGRMAAIIAGLSIEVRPFLDEAQD
jgi:hypothetical protein